MNDVSKEEKLDPAKPILWIVIPCYNEKDVLPITAPMFLEQIQTMISKEKISAKSRILFVNDGSKDSTWDIICKLAQEDEYYIADLIGMDVITDEGEEGKLVDVIETGANEVYVVEFDKYGEVLIPAIHDCILDVDIEAMSMKVHLLEGLV